MSSPSEISVDAEIYSCLNLDTPKSFFLFAGAGSGKTRSLVEVLSKFRNEYASRLKTTGQRVAIITYTNAACDEINRRLDFDSTFVVSTIHSFAWELVKPHQIDIKEWLKDETQKQIAELEEKQSRGRAGTKAAIDRPIQIESKKKRLLNIDSTERFTYSPSGENSMPSALNHAEVISITINFLSNRPLLSRILIQKYPILLIDESQDTKKDLIEVLFEIQSEHSSQFTLGLFGDTMQRIYSEGKVDLGTAIPDTWATPAKKINYRSPHRVVKLINKIRDAADGENQDPTENKENGHVRLFICDTNEETDQLSIEKTVAEMMAEVTGDVDWSRNDESVKVLTLEHHMAAKRGGFSDFFDPIYSVSKMRTGLIDGKLSGSNLFTKQILPLIQAKKKNDDFSVARIVKEHSPLMMKDILKSSDAPKDIIAEVRSSVNSLYELWEGGQAPNLNEVLKEVSRTNLFPIPSIFAPIVSRLNSEDQIEEEEEEEDDDERDPVINAWDQAMQCSFDQIETYVDYISDQSRFGTHQGIKGREFPRVMVILDDEVARGFMFSYDKLFGVKEPTATDIKNEAEGTETSLDRTRRLFYVTCSRAEESLAIVAYTKDPEKIKRHSLSEGWFEENEIIEIPTKIDS